MFRSVIAFQKMFTDNFQQSAETSDAKDLRLDNLYQLVLQLTMRKILLRISKHVLPINCCPPSCTWASLQRGCYKILPAHQAAVRGFHGERAAFGSITWWNMRQLHALCWTEMPFGGHFIVHHKCVSAQWWSTEFEGWVFCYLQRRQHEEGHIWANEYVYIHSKI